VRQACKHAKMLAYLVAARIKIFKRPQTA
jgi:hypothetical protein